MKKILPILVVSILVLSGLGAGAISETKRKTILYPTNADEYDMVIIAPEKFSTLIQPLIDHKNSYGIQTVLKTTEDIYNEYEGRDKPEQIKYFIKDAIVSWNISYVLLVGGLKSLLWSVPRDNVNHGTKGWYVPVRYTNMVEPSSYQIFDPGFIDNSGNFSSWDSNENNIFAEWNMRTMEDIDVLDMYPDVAVGRLACRNKFEVKIVVDKIINYEKSSSDKPWYNRFIAAGGDPLNDIPTEYAEGEILGDHIINNYMTDFEPVRLYASYQNSNDDMTPKYENIRRELKNGCGFFLLDAHGAPAETKTFWPGDFDQENMIKCLSVYNLPFLNNGEKLPICILGGCWCCQFNVSLLGNYISEYDYWGKTTPECIGWRLVRKPNGGGIATIGFSALGYIRYLGENGDIDGDGIDEPDYVENGWGFLESCFFEAIHDGDKFLGDAWMIAETKYLSTFPIENKYDWQEAKDLLAWTLLGDPSLKIGGYP
jgi:hypothetical protein